MDEKDEEFIRSNYTKLIKNLQEDDGIEKVCNFLYEKKIITLAMKQKVLCQKTPTMKGSQLLDLIVKRGTRAYGMLYEACQQNGLMKAAEILRLNKSHCMVSTRGPAFQEQEAPLPDIWPTQEHYERVRDNKLSVKQVPTNVKSAMLELFHSKTGNSVYEMKHQRRGTALIILNDNFPCTNFSRREGSDMDEEGLDQLFKGLGFHVVFRRNLKQEWIYKTIDEELSKDHQHHDCFVFFILSHGDQGLVFDTEGESVSMRSIIDRFSDAVSLKDKPKLLFFQACQGKFADRGMTGVYTAQTEDDEELTKSDQAKFSSSPEKGEELNKHDGPRGVSCPENLSIPLYDDIFLFRSSPDGCYSYRNQEWGSWFTQAVIYVFSEFAHLCEICELQAKVNALLSKAETQTNKFKHISEFSFVPGTKFYFFPGLYTYPSDSKNGTEKPS